MRQKAKIIVIDANILIRAVLGIRTFSLIANNSHKVNFFTPKFCYQEVNLHIPNIAKKRKFTVIEEQNALHILNDLRKIVIDIDENIYIHHKQAAQNRLNGRDEKDWSIVALALTLDSVIWTEDQDFFGIGIATWRTKNIEIFFDSF